MEEEEGALRRVRERVRVGELAQECGELRGCIEVVRRSVAYVR